jgi:hypothetical protein
MCVSEVPSRGKPELCGVSVSASRTELGKTMSSVRPAMHQGADGNGFRGNTGKDIKGMGRDDIREVRDYSNAVPGIGSLVRRGVNGWSGMRKSRGRIRM